MRKSNPRDNMVSSSTATGDRQVFANQKGPIRHTQAIFPLYRAGSPGWLSLRARCKLKGEPENRLAGESWKSRQS